MCQTYSALIHITICVQCVSFSQFVQGATDIIGTPSIIIHSAKCDLLIEKSTISPSVMQQIHAVQVKRTLGELDDIQNK